MLGLLPPLRDRLEVLEIPGYTRREKLAIARQFLETRTRLNTVVSAADNPLVKRFYNIDHNTYLEGAIPAKYKELMGDMTKPMLNRSTRIPQARSARKCPCPTPARPW